MMLKIIVMEFVANTEVFRKITFDGDNHSLGTTITGNDVELTASVGHCAETHVYLPILIDRCFINRICRSTETVGRLLSYVDFTEGTWLPSRLQVQAN